MMYGESWFMHFWVDNLIVLYIFGFGTARLEEWRLNYIHSINGAEDINASCSDSSAEIDYSYYHCGSQLFASSWWKDDAQTLQHPWLCQQE